MLKREQLHTDTGLIEILFTDPKKKGFYMKQRRIIQE